MTGHGCLTQATVNGATQAVISWLRGVRNGNVASGKCSNPDCPVCWPKPVVLWAGAESEDGDGAEQ
jgi:hypothetical protein